jgi:flagellar assembly factor FliW
MAMNKLANNNVLIDFFIINTFNILSNYTYKVPNYEIVIL